MSDADVPGIFESTDASSGIQLTSDAACAVAVEQAVVEPRPVDIIWMVDNSVSMRPAVAAVTSGLNAFASLIATRKLDYRVIMLSLKGKASPVRLGGSDRYPVCIPPPLAGSADCGNGPRFFQASLDVKSTQPLEQFLGTLGQTEGYTAGTQRGSEPWASELRATATKTIVLVTDDNSRLSASQFEQFGGGENPQIQSLNLPPGILHPSRNGQFNDYVFAAIYGWGSPTNPGATCRYPGSAGSPPSSGATYTELVGKTGGPRAQICDSSATAWNGFFDAVAQAVVKSAKVSCELAVPKPKAGTLDPERVNVDLRSDAGQSTRIKKVANVSACSSDAAWYYDNEVAPTKVLLCPAACTLAQSAVGVGKLGRVEVLFGCKTDIK
jgi:hypothetical protein